MNENTFEVLRDGTVLINGTVLYRIKEIDIARITATAPALVTVTFAVHDLIINYGGIKGISQESQ